MTPVVISIAPDLLSHLQALRSCLDEVLRAFHGARNAPAEPRPAVRPDAVARSNANSGGRRHRYWLFGVEHTAPTTIASTIEILKDLARYDDDFYPKLAPAVRGRTRNHLARSRSDVYPKRPNLARDAKEIAPGWFFGGNISNPEKENILRAACKVMGIVFGRDLKIDWPKGEP